MDADIQGFSATGRLFHYATPESVPHYWTNYCGSCGVMKSVPSYYRWLLALGLLAVINQLIQYYFSTPLPFLRSYLDDILAMPILLGIWRWEQQSYWGISYLKPFQIIAFTLVIFVLFEHIAPRFIGGFTADWWDGVAYSAGSLAFWTIQNNHPIAHTQG